MDCTWSRNELIAYIFLFAAHSDLKEDNHERNLIISKVDMNTFQKVHDEFESDNDYQSLQKITEGLKALNYTQEDIADLLKEIKVMFFADGSFDVYERILFRSLKNILK